MVTLILIGLIGGLITGISPCILPVLPVIFLAGGNATTAPDAEGAAEAEAEGSGAVATKTRRRVRVGPRNRRPYAVIAGLVLSFTFFTLAGTLIISALDLPPDVLRIVGLTLLVLIGLGLLFPRFEEILEKPFSWIPQRSPNQESGAFVLGLGLGVLYVPCAGPVLTAITVASATGQIGLSTVALTLAFAIGATLPLLLFALAGRRVSERVKAFRTRQRLVRSIGGVVMILLALALAFNVQEFIQRAIPDYTAGLQKQVSENDAVAKAVAPSLSVYANDSNKLLANCTDGSPTLADCGPAPALMKIDKWFNTVKPEGITLDQLRGKVTLIDFWTYSCINCQRSVPHVKAWDAVYRAAGLQVIGVHSPEFTFERDAGNVADGISRFGITYPVAMDNSLATFSNYRNKYWPAEYLIDAQGNVRYLKFGEGNYTTTEGHIRELLTAANPAVALPGPTEVTDQTVTDANTTRETYLNYRQIQQSYYGEPLASDTTRSYPGATDLPKDGVTLSGSWTVNYDNFQAAGTDARIGLHYAARNVYVVIGGEGTATVDIDGVGKRSFAVSGAPRIYPLIEGEMAEKNLRLDLTPGLQAYVFTFG